MKHVYLVSICLLLCTSCEPDIVANNQRTIVELSLSDMDDAPLSDINVSYFASADGIFVQDEEVLGTSLDSILGQGITDANGEVSFISLVHLSRTSDGVILINASDSFFELSPNPLYETIIYKLENPVDDKVNLPETTLRKTAEVQFNINRITATNTTLFYTLSYKNTVSLINFPSGERLDTREFTGDLTPSESENLRIIHTPQGSMVTLSYRLFDDAGLVDEGVVTYEITTNTEDYEFTF